MKNKLSDLNNHLFAQLERLGEEGLSAEAITGLAEQIIRNADLQLKAANLLALHGDRFRPMLPMIEAKPE